MTLYSFASLEDSPPPETTLAMLAFALEGRRVEAANRVLSADDSRNPDEGLALITAYVSITDKHVRQAILDTVIAIARSSPYRRSRALIGPTSDDLAG